MPRFGYRTGGLPGQPVERACAALAHLGYDCVELCLEPADMRPDSLDAARCAELRCSIDGLGLTLASLSYHGDREPAGERRVAQEQAVRAAGRLGAAVLVVNSERAADEPGRRSGQWAEHVTHFAHLCRLAEEAGVDLALEPEPLLVVGSSQDMLDLLRDVGSARLKVNLDLGHAQVTDPDPVDSIRRLGTHIVHLHLEDIAGRVHRHLMFGEGQIDFVSAQAALLEVGYRGPYVADLFGQDEPVVAAGRALAAMRRHFAS